MFIFASLILLGKINCMQHIPEVYIVRPALRGKVKNKVQERNCKSIIIKALLCNTAPYLYKFSIQHHTTCCFKITTDSKYVHICDLIAGLRKVKVLARVSKQYKL